MGHFWVADHEEGGFLPGWSNPADSRSEIVPPPDDSESAVGDFVLHVTGHDIPVKLAPNVVFDAARLVVYGTLLVYPSTEESESGGRLNSFRMCAGGGGLIVDAFLVGRAAGGTCGVGEPDVFAIYLVGSGPNYTAVVRAGSPDQDNFTTTTRASAQVNGVMEGQWNRIDFFVKFTDAGMLGSHTRWTVDVGIRVECGNPATGSATTTLFEGFGLSPAIRRVGVPDSIGTRELYLDNLALFDEESGWYCESSENVFSLQPVLGEVDLEFEIELPELRPRPLLLPHRGADPGVEDNYRTIERWVNTLTDDTAYDWPEGWEAEEEP